MGKEFLPGHAAWCTLLMWSCSLIGALIANQIFLPRVIGMLVAGILLQNIPWAAIDAFPSKWGVQMRAGALATIFLRCGLELDFGTMQRYKFPAIRLALIPGLAEALFDAGLAVAFFNMDYSLGLCMGFILKAVGPGLVVPAMFKLQRTKKGTDQGIPSTVVIAASFDDIIAITGYAIFSTIAIQPSPGSTDSGENIGWSIASGPLQVVFGIVGGFLAGGAVGATKLWDTTMKRFIALLGAGLLLMFFLEYFSLLSGGALGALFTGLVASNLWEKGMPKFASLGPSLVYSPECERLMSLVWRWIMEPILFVTVGSTLDFSKLETGTIPKSVVIVVCGVTLRIFCTYAAMSGFTYTWREKVFYSLAWTPKATVQAALSAAPLALIKSYKSGSPDYDQWVTWGNEILTTGLFAIIICGTLGVMAIHFSAPVLLKDAVESDEDETEGGESVPEGGHISSIHGAQGDNGAKDGNGTNVFLEVPSTAPVATLTHPTTADFSDIHQARRISASRRVSSEANMNRGFPTDRMKRAQSDVLHPPRPVSPPVLVAGEDLSLVAEYIDAIQHLTTAVSAGEAAYSQEDVQRLSEHVRFMQNRIESEVGRREPSVRELFRNATSLVDRRSVRGYHHMRHRSMDKGAGGGGKGGDGSGHGGMSGRDDNV